MSLDLNIVKIGAGRPARPLSVIVSREVNDADMELLATVPRNTSAPTLQRITDRHHALARLLAAGTPEGEAAIALNYTPSRVSVIKASPAFGELLALYRSEVDREFAGVLDHMSGLSRDAILELRDRLEDDPAKFSNRELLSITTDMVDRSAGDSGRVAAPTRIELVAPEVGGED